MPAYNVSFTDEAWEDFTCFKESGNKAAAKKILAFVDELEEHPTIGTGQVEQLRHFAPLIRFSRRINQEHRLVYDIDEEAKTVTVMSAKGHYK